MYSPASSRASSRASSISSYKSSISGARTSENRSTMIEKLKKLYAKRDFLENILKETNENHISIKNKIISKYQGRYTVSLDPVIEEIFAIYVVQKENINAEIRKLENSLDFGMHSRITHTRKELLPGSRNIYEKYGKLPAKNVNNILHQKEIYNRGLNNSIYSPNHIGYNPYTKTLNNSQIAYIDSLLGIKNNGSVSSISSGSSYGGKGKKRTTTATKGKKGKKRVTSTKGKKRTSITKSKKPVIKK